MTKISELLESNSISKSKLMEFLMKDREHHFQNPRNINTRLLYAIGGILATLFISLILKNPNEQVLNSFIELSKENYCPILFVFIGLLFIIWALIENIQLHTNQRKQLERAIHYLLTDEEYSYKRFKEKYSKKRLSFFFGKCKRPTRIFDYKPDTRCWIFYHDRKSELGIILIILSLVYIWWNVAEMST